MQFYLLSYKLKFSIKQINEELVLRYNTWYKVNQIIEVQCLKQISEIHIALLFFRQLSISDIHNILLGFDTATLSQNHHLFLCVDQNK